MTKVVTRIAQTLSAIAMCEASDRDMSYAIDKHQERLDALMEDAPRGSGIDMGTKIDRDASEANRLVFQTAFHHMNEHGFYDGWTEHRVIVTPCLVHGFSIRLTGRDRNAIKDYLADVYQTWLSSETAV